MVDPGTVLAILGLPPLAGVYGGSLALAVGTRTVGSADAALREAERASVFLTAGCTIPAGLGCLDYVVLTA